MLLNFFLLSMVIGLALSSDGEVQQKQSKDESKDSGLKIEPYSISQGGNETEGSKTKPYTNTLLPQPRGSKKCGKCVRNAYCPRWSYRCRCRRGYRGNAYKQCYRRAQWFQVAKATVCESSKQTIRCHWRKVINIYYAKYGRDNKRTCKSKSIKTTKCAAKGATAKLKKTCNGKRHCVLHAHNSVFGDPCVGTHKFLRVYYGCRRACSRNGFFKRGRCWCKKGFRGNGYWCRKIKGCRRSVDEEVPASRRPIGTLPDPEYSDRLEERDADIDNDMREQERRTVQEEVPASKRTMGIYPEREDSEKLDARDITDDEEYHVRVKRGGDDVESEDGEAEQDDDTGDVEERDVQTEEGADDDDDEESDVLTTREVEDDEDKEPEENGLDDDKKDLVARTTGDDTEDEEDEEVEVSRRARPYCGKFGKVRGGKCKCNRRYCKNRRGKCVAKGNKKCGCKRGAEKRGKHGRCVCKRGYNRNKRGICV